MSCFNPRTRVGCDLLLSVGFGGMEADVSIHAPAWGATNANESPFRLMKCFNPRTRVGCDGPAAPPPKGAGHVSIHAPAWGATDSIPARARAPTRFNPRTRVGCDLYAVLSGCSVVKFQSTHPRGVRQPLAHLCVRGRGVSIHAPAWGATGDAARPAGGNVTFQSTHPRGVRRTLHGRIRVTTDVSIHAPAWGATCAARTSPRPPSCFNPRTRVGCDTNSNNFQQYCDVSIHAPAWGATTRTP